MAKPAEVYVAGMRTTLRAVKEAGDEVQKAVKQDFQAVVGPTVSDIRGRFTALGKTGPRTARTVRGSFTQSKAELRMGGRGGPAWGFEMGTEFGAKNQPKTSTFVQRRPSGTVRVTRSQDYSKNFGLWTGNQWRNEGAVSGNAFYPGIKDHYVELVDGVVKTIDQALARVGNRFDLAP